MKEASKSISSFFLNHFKLHFYHVHPKILTNTLYKKAEVKIVKNGMGVQKVNQRAN